MRRAAAALALLLAWAGPAAADVAADLRAAAGSLQSGEYQRAADLAGPVARLPAMERADRAEAWRVYGLALFFLDRRAEAEVALLEYLKLDVDAHLDPVLVPPEAIAFFEDVRLRHAAELKAYRPGPKRRRYLILVPPLGQFQNGTRTRGWLIAGGGLGAALTAGVSFYLLDRWCSEPGQTCIEGRTDDARTLRSVNHVAVYATVAIYLYGVLDAYVVDRRLRHEEEQLQLGIVPAQGAPGAVLVWGGRF